MKPVTRNRFIAIYNYPGIFFPETASRDISAPTVATAIAEGPDEKGYFSKDGWYSVEIVSKTERLYTSGDESVWVAENSEVVTRAVVGKRVHVDDIPKTDTNSILISNIEYNSKSGYGVQTRCGNWQFAEDFDTIIDPEDAQR